MNAPSEMLLADMKVLMTDVEELIKATAAQSGEKITEVRNRLQQAAADLRPRLAHAEATAEEMARTAVLTTDRYVHVHPWTSIGVAAGFGLIIGLLIGRR